jgi:uncharacterized membrane protein required for colicin V production
MNKLIDYVLGAVFSILMGLVLATIWIYAKGWY